MKTFLSLVVAVLIMTACNNNNKKPGGGALDGVDKPNTPKVTGGGGWSTADQQKFLQTCVQNALNAGADQQTSNAHCNCTLQKIAAKYASYDDANNKMTSEEVNAMEQQCIQERTGGNNGNGGNFGNDGGGDNENN